MPEHGILHTDPLEVSAVRVTATPTYGRSVTGYGPRIPTRYMIRLGTRWHRVYAMVYGNSGSVYVQRGGTTLFIDSATEGWLESVSAWADRLESPVATAVRPVTA